jgi:molybdopterin-containing oxidoreductase family membrane subunit
MAFGRSLGNFIVGSAKAVLRGPPTYWLWLAFLVGLIAAGLWAYINQLDQGLGVSAMRDQVSWGLYIGNFTFLVGVAAAAVVLVIPAYIYDWKPIKEIVILGELLAISAIVMCILFVTVDVGRPDRVWHLFPLAGALNFPTSLLAWDVVVLTLYFLLNLTIVTFLLYKGYVGQEYNKKVILPLVLLSIPMAVSIHTVTAFLYNGLAARPFWNASILAPRFLASAFCSGPAIMLMLLQILRKFTRFEIKDEAIWKIAELMAYAMFINLFLLGAELFKEFYSDTHHLLFHEYMFRGIGEHKALVPYTWIGLGLQVLAFVLFLWPKARRNVITLNIGCVAIYGGVYIEKGIGLVIPGQTPDTLGEIYEYTPTINELLVTAGVFAIGFLLFTVMVKVAVPITLGELAAPGANTTPTTSKPSND